MSEKQVAPPATPYGAPISLAQAKTVMAAAEAEATKNNWGVAIVIVDSGGNTVMSQRLENTQLGGMRVAEQKARTSIEFRRPTKIFEGAVAGGGLGIRVLTFDISCAEGGVPIVKNGAIIGAIGVSGVQSFEDGQVAQAGADAV